MLPLDLGSLAPDARHFIGRAPLAGAAADPVLTLQTFETEEEALALAHHATYGFCAGVYTRDLSRALRVMRRIEAGTVWINRYGRSRDHILPTGGYKVSFLGKDLGREAYHANRRSKSVLIDIAREAA
jgi:aldehyde dehydrogenase (NAD+)